MTTSKYINTSGIGILDRLRGIISTIGYKRQLRKEAKAKRKYEKLCRKFNFGINPSATREYYLVMNGSLFRILFLEVGLSITDGEGQFVECQLTRLKVLKAFVKNS
ncbi:hypothetical protein [Enterovibrio calviensis]|uniref:hypothetical protein n=1 Tax=Enterovibrio calviensis TaxID=91359 RepID=UPI00138E1549|nr:hypothetical protein [Enterovibrio calviensis]